MGFSQDYCAWPFSYIRTINRIPSEISRSFSNSSKASRRIPSIGKLGDLVAKINLNFFKGPGFCSSICSVSTVYKKKSNFYKLEHETSVTNSGKVKEKFRIFHVLNMSRLAHKQYVIQRCSFQVQTCRDLFQTRFILRKRRR